MLKINFDGAVFRKENRSGVGVVIWNSKALVIASLSQQLPRAYQPLEVEALAVVRALEFGAKIGLKEMVIEGDLEIIVNELKADGSAMGSVALILQDATLFSSFFTKLLYSHVRREGNKLVYSLARHSLNVIDYAVWIEDVPPPFFFLLCKLI